MKALLKWIKSDRIMLVNSGSLVGTTAVTSALGFVYWWVAARQFSPESVGIASASVSAMMLLGSLCMLGLGTLLITELPRQPGQEVSLISTALVVVGGVGGGVGVLFAVVAPYVSAQFNPLKASIGDIIAFAVGVSLTAITLVLDQALIGILRGSLQFWRNTSFAVAKLLLLFMISLFLSQKTGMTIYDAWALGIALSLAVLLGFAIYKGGWPGKAILPQWALLRKLGPVALQHHLLNLMIQAPTLLLPVLVTVMLSAKANAWFYVSWMIANFVFVVPYALTTTLHAMTSAQQSSLQHRARITIGLAFVTSLVANCVLQLAAKQVLGLFGSSYAEQAAWCLRILVLAAFPTVITSHYVSFCRIQDQITSAMRGMVVWGLLELAGAALGVRLGGLLGLRLGLLLAAIVEAIFMFPTVYKVVRPVKSALPVPVVDQGDYRETEAIWLADTIMLAAISPSYTVGAQVAAYPKRIEPLPRRSIQQNDSSYAKSPLRPIRLQYLSYQQDMHMDITAIAEADTEETIVCRAERYRDPVIITPNGSRK